MPQPSTPAVKIVLTVSVSHCGSSSCDRLDMDDGLARATTLIDGRRRRSASSRRRVATDTAASTAGPAANPETADSTPVNTATGTGQRRRKNTATNATDAERRRRARTVRCSHWASASGVQATADTASMPAIRHVCPHGVSGGEYSSGVGRSTRQG